MGVHKLSAGSGYTYLTSQVAAHDATGVSPGSLEAYYSEKGESPGRWVGAGAEGFGLAGTVVSEAQMKALFGEGIHPDADRIQAELAAAGAGAKQIAAAVRLGREFTVVNTASDFPRRLAVAYAEHNTTRGVKARAAIDAQARAVIRTRVARDMFTEAYQRPPGDDRELSGWIARNTRPDSVSVAGFDFTFSPVKSVSAWWALAPRETAAVIEQAHHDAIGEVLDWFQAHAAYTRQGAGGVRQVEIRGVTGALFTHRDSRAGDPDLHTHVAVSNKVQNLAGKWLTLDGRAVYKANVAMSEMYTSALERRLTEQLGVRFADREPGVDGKRPVREIVGLDPGLAALWSSRRLVIEDRRGELAAQFHRDQHRPPTAKEAIALAEQATLETRQAKHESRSLAEQRATWATEAGGLLGPGGITAMLTGIDHARASTPAPPAVTADLAAGLAARVVEEVSTRRSVWNELHVRAEADRQVRAAGVAPNLHVELVDQVVARVLDPAVSVAVNPAPRLPGGVGEPGLLRRRDGASQYTVWASTLYTSDAVLAAEARIVAAAGRGGGRRVDANAVGIALLEQAANGQDLNTGQAQLVETFATSGARVQLALAPAGTGKTTAMRVLTSAWTSTGGTVVGLSPTAAAAKELASAIGRNADTLDKLVFHIHRPDLAEPAWMRRVDASTLAVVDEAGLASTRTLDTALTWLTARGASVRLIGDDRQLASVEAGGVLRDIASAHGALTLTDVVRFHDPAEGPASLALRARDPAALGFYLDRGRIHVGDPATTLGAAYAAWAADRVAGIDSVMLAGTHDQVTALNAQARADRLTRHPDPTATPVPAGGQVPVGHGLAASAGDTIITKRNDRRLTLGASDFVRNGYRFTVRAVGDDGSLTAVQVGTNRAVTLPAGYVSEHVQLGYAVTFDAAQGLTVGSRDRAGTAHTVIDPASTSTQQLYESLTRAVTANHLYVQVVGAGAEHDLVRPETVSPQTGIELLTAVLARDGAQVSAHTAAAAAGNAVTLLPGAAGQYADALGVAAETVIGAHRLAAITAAADTVAPGVTAAPAWETLRAHLALIDAHGRDPISELAAALDRRTLTDAGDPAAVLDWRLDPTHQRGPAGPLPWLHAIPARVADHPDWGPYLTAVAERVATLAGGVAAQARAWADPVTGADAPAWARPLQALDVHPALLAEIAVWRYAHDIDDTERRATGPAVPAAHEQALQTRLEDQVHAAGYLLDRAGADWTRLAGGIHTGLVEDPFWPVLATRLTHAAAAGIDVQALLTAAAAERPLPDEIPAAALWSRLVEHVGDIDAPTGSGLTLRPAWAAQLDRHHGEDAALRVMAAPAWPAVVARVDAATRTGTDPEVVFSQALTSITDHAHGPGQLAEALLWHVALLTDPTPADPDTTPAVADPVDADREPPHDLHLLLHTDKPSAPAAAAADGVVPDGADDAWWNTLPDPVVAEADQWAPTPEDLTAAEPNVDELPRPGELDPTLDALDWSSTLTPAPVPYPELTVGQRVEQLRHDLDQVRAELAAYRALLAADRGPHLLATQPVLAGLRARRDAVADLEADHHGAYADWIDADRHAEITAHDLDTARARLAVLTAAGDAADPEQVAIAEGGVFLAAAAATAASAWAAETHRTYRALDDALTAAAGPAGVVRTADIDHARLTAHSLDDAHTTTLTQKVTTVSDQLFRAENAAARHDAAGELLVLTAAAATPQPDPALAALTDVEPAAAAVAVLDEPATVRWAELAEQTVPGVTGAPGWAEMAAALDRLAAAGYDLAEILPAAAGTAPLPRQAANELRYRLYETYPAAITPISAETAAAMYEPSSGSLSLQERELRDNIRREPDAGIDR